jgi:hypothetical protein
MNLVGEVGPDQERLKQLHGEDYTHQLVVAVAAIVGTWTGHDSSSDLGRNRRMGEVERSRCLCTAEVGGNCRRLWEDEAAKSLHGWVDAGGCSDMLT